MKRNEFPQLSIHRERLLALAAVSLLLLLAACSGAPTADPPTPTAENTPTPAATPTPTPPPGRLVLVAPPEADPSEAQLTQGLLETAAAANGLFFEARPALEAGEIGPEWKVVVFLTPPANLAELTSAAPETQFAVVTSTDLAAGGNLSVLHRRPEWQAFVAGYLSVLITPDLRLGALLPGNPPLVEEAFRNGVRYFCGLCNSYYSPILRFPLIAAQPAGSDLALWQGALGEMRNSIVYTYYIAPEVATAELLDALAAQNVTLVGGVTPPGEARANWAATVRQDLGAPLAEMIPALIAGQGGLTFEAGIEISDAREDIVTPGKRKYVEEMMADLFAGAVYPLNPPLE